MTLIYWLQKSLELKTKLTQHSVNKLREIGIQPNILICRTQKPLDDDIKKKIALFTNVGVQRVISGLEVDFVYQIPILFQQEKLHMEIAKIFKLENKQPNLAKWRDVVHRYQNAKQKVLIGIAGKYMKVKDSYKSVFEALVHAATFHNLKVELVSLDIEVMQNTEVSNLGCDGIIIPGGFGRRGIEGKIQLAGHARKNNIPFLGICYGFQAAIIEFAREVVGLKNVHSTEVDVDVENPIIELMEEQKKKANLGGTMRLGMYPIKCLADSKIARIYQKIHFKERHRHRFEMNNKYIKPLQEKGMVFSAFYSKANLVEAIEIKNHPWFIAVQYHPEFISRLFKPHPIFCSFIQAAYKYNHS